MISLAPLFGLAKTVLAAAAPIAIAKTITNYTRRRDEGGDIGESIVGACVDTGCQCLSTISGIPLDDDKDTSKRTYKVKYQAEPSYPVTAQPIEQPKTVVAFYCPNNYQQLTDNRERPYVRVIDPTLY